MKSRAESVARLLRLYRIPGVVLLGVLAATGIAVAATPAASPATIVSAAATQQSPAGKIRHVVVVYQENHSFDDTLGKFCQVHAGRCDGYVGPVRLEDGSVVNMTQSSDIVALVFHDVRSQDIAINGGAMDGWNHVVGCRAHEHYACLTYYSPSQIPNLAA